MSNANQNYVFAERMKMLRLKAGLTQRKLGELVGMQEGAYQSYEYGNRKPGIELAIKFADILEVSLDYLCGRTDNPELNR